MKAEQLMTADQVAEYLQVSTKTMDDWRRKKHGPRWIKVGGSIRYRVRDVDAYLDAQTVETRTATSCSMEVG